ncbi:uncharacterized protein LOC111319666, partial [Stylophora pistillata]|uniref:uncharacterized protein LOC111319666 n=1 Tax=Stylophora pistillata TaxID=50429 RepID=UPI000C04A948
MGSGGSPLLSGYSQHHQNIEDLFCEKLGFEKALIYPSGYQANIGILSTLLESKSIVLADRFIHASVVDGIRLSGAKLIRFAHNDIDHFTNLIQKYKPHLVITESIYSMQGDIAPLEKISTFCAQHSIPFMVDDAHGFGVLGESGLGAMDHWNFKDFSPEILTIPFGKALGFSGCIVLSSAK